MRLLCITLHYFDFAGVSEFVGRSTSLENADARHEIVNACQGELAAAAAAVCPDVEMLTAGIPTSGLLPVNADLSAAVATPRHLAFACIDLAYRLISDFDFVLVVEDDIAVPPSTLLDLQALLAALPATAVAIPNRLERFGSRDVCIDTLAMPGWRGEAMTAVRHRLRRPANIHSAMLFMDRERFQAAYEARTHHEPTIILGDYIASGFANVNGALDVLRALPTDRALPIHHRDPWLPTWQAGLNLSDADADALITAVGDQERDAPTEVRPPVPPPATDFTESPGSTPRRRPDPPTVSVVIPAFNARPTIARTVESVIRHATEVIVVDDGSRDGTADEIESRFAGARVVRTRNRGVGRARNLGLSLCASEVVVFLDADDYYLGDALAYVAERMADPGVDMLSHSAQVVGSDGEVWVGDDRYLKAEASDLTGQELLVLESERQWLSASMLTYAFRRRFLRDTRLAFPPTLHEDEYFTVAALIRAGRVESTSRTCCTRTLRPGSIMQSPRTYRNAEGWGFAARLLRREAADAGDRIGPGCRDVLLSRVAKLDDNVRMTHAEVGFGTREALAQMRMRLRRTPRQPG